METYKSWLSNTFKEVDIKVREMAFANVVGRLKKEGINIEEMDREDLEEMIASEVKEIKAFGKGAIVALAGLELLDLLL